MCTDTNKRTTCVASLAASLQYVRDELQLSSTQQEIVSATATLSDAASMLVGGRLADAYGRKSVALVACVCSIAGALGASGFSSGFATLFFWRLVSGVGNGLSILLLPMYISESVAADSRGTFLTLFQLGYVWMACVTKMSGLDGSG